MAGYVRSSTTKEITGLRGANPDDGSRYSLARGESHGVQYCPGAVNQISTFPKPCLGKMPKIVSR